MPSLQVLFGFSAVCMSTLALAQAPSYSPYLVTCPTTPLITRAGTPATQNQTLPAGEATYMTNRQTNVLPSLWSTYLSDKASGTTGYNLTTFSTGANYPKLALAVSGGGFRASLYGAGTLSSFDSRNATNSGPLLQLASYLSGLSGGSWAVTSFAMNDLPDAFSLVLGTGVAGDSGWELDMDLLAPDGALGLLDNADYYDDMLEDIRLKAAAGFPVSIIDIWGRAIAYHMYNQTDSADFYANGPHDQGTLFSSIKYTQNFQAGAMPLPLIVATSRVNAQQQENNTSEGNTNIIPLSNTQFELTPYAFGSFDPTLSAHIPMEYAGTYLNNGAPVNSSACVNGYENVGFVAGTSAALLNAAEEVVTDTTFISLISDLSNDIAGIQAANYSIPLVANWPNSFFGFEPSNTSFKFESSGNDILQLTDGGENGENVPISPLFVRARGLDLIVAVDSSADTSFGWPNGTSLLLTQERMKMYPENVFAFPPIPGTQDEFVSEGLNVRPTFFGCNTTSANTNSSSSSYYPILVYLPNAPPPTTTPTTYLTNTSTYQLSYSQADAQSFLEAAHLNGLKGFQNSTSEADSEWPLCLKCAVVERARKRAGVERTAACQSCLSKYCWSDAVAESLANATASSTGSGSGTVPKSAGHLTAQLSSSSLLAGFVLVSAMALSL